MTIVNARPTCFYHPIRVIFLDDNRAFLDVLDLEFGQKFNIMTLTSPDTAFRVVDNHSQDVIQSIFKLMEDVNVDTTNDRVIAFDISKMLNLIYNKTRFEYIPLLVVDYEMPTINGIEFCRKLKREKSLKLC